MTPIILEMGEVTYPYYADAAAKAIAEIPAEAFTQYTDPDFEFLKRACNDVSKMPPAVSLMIQKLQSLSFISYVEHLTGINGLVRDDSLWGGGVHVTMTDGYLAMHRDFNVLPTSYRDELQMRRAANLIMYLTPEWESDWDGELHIDGQPMIEPLFGRTVIFDPTQALHGHPFPYRGVAPRQSIAVYYYVREKVPMREWRSTQYEPLPWKKDTLESRLKRQKRAYAPERYAKWWPTEGWDANGSPVSQ